jgi:hypothetical protein
MLKLELDWAGDDAPEVGVVSDADDAVLVVVDYDDARVGPAGWPTVRVIALALHDAPAYSESMALDAWVLDVYGEDDDDERDALVAFAVVV